MPQPGLSPRVSAAIRPGRRRLLRERAEQRAELDRRVRRVVAMMRSLRSR